MGAVRLDLDVPAGLARGQAAQQSCPARGAGGADEHRGPQEDSGEHREHRPVVGVGVAESPGSFLAEGVDHDGDVLALAVGARVVDPEVVGPGADAHVEAVLERVDAGDDGLGGTAALVEVDEGGAAVEPEQHRDEAGDDQQPRDEASRQSPRVRPAGEGYHLVLQWAAVRAGHVDLGAAERDVGDDDGEPHEPQVPDDQPGAGVAEG
ncbi:MAG: hypothetical protein PGN15_11805 [Aeromicrobium erythreum]